MQYSLFPSQKTDTVIEILQVINNNIKKGDDLQTPCRWSVLFFKGL